MAFRTLSPGQSFTCDAIRYLAALAVAFHHLPRSLKPAQYVEWAERPLTNLGEIGVTAFFVLSGFLISYTVARKSHSGPYSFGEYMIERSVRIYLVFIPAMTLVIFVGALSTITGFGTDDFQWNRFDLWHFITNLLMLSGVRQIVPHGVTFSFMEQSWSLNYEFFFYIMFGALMLPIAAGRHRSLAKWLIVAAVALLALQLVRSRLLVLGLAWVLGVMAARLFVAGAKSGRAHGVALAGIAMAVYLLPATALVERLLLATLMATAISYAVSISEGMCPAKWAAGAAATLAGYSYSLYLIHILVLWVIFYAYNPPAQWVVSSLGPVAAFCLAMLIINISAWLFSLVSERHNGAVRRRLIGMLGSAGVHPAAKARAVSSTASDGR